MPFVNTEYTKQNPDYFIENISPCITTSECTIAAIHTALMSRICATQSASTALTGLLGKDLCLCYSMLFMCDSLPACKSFLRTVSSHQARMSPA